MNVDFSGRSGDVRGPAQGHACSAVLDGSAAPQIRERRTPASGWQPTPRKRSREFLSDILQLPDCIRARIDLEQRSGSGAYLKLAEQEPRHSIAVTSTADSRL